MYRTIAAAQPKAKIRSRIIVVIIDTSIRISHLRTGNRHPEMLFVFTFHVDNRQVIHRVLVYR